MQISQISVRPILKDEEPAYTLLMETHHYLGAIPKLAKPYGTWQPIKHNGLH